MQRLNKYKRKYLSNSKKSILMLLLLVLLLGVGYSYLTTNLSMLGDVAVERTISFPLQIQEVVDTESCMTKYTGQVTDQVGETVTASNVYFNKCSDKNNVIFGGFCWQMIRTTETGGIKMIYNGEPVNGKCESSRSDHIGIVGTDGTPDSLNSEYLYGSSFTYDTTNNSFTLVDTTLATWGSSTYESLIGKYTCKNTTGTCTTLYNVNGYIYDINQAYTSSYTVGNTNYASIGKSPFNANKNSPAMTGYMFNKVYDHIDIYPVDSDQYRFGSAFTYNNGTYTLSGTNYIIDNWSSNSVADDLNLHYTCWNTTGTCSTLSYVYAGDSYMLFYIELQNGKGVNEALTEMLSSNDVNRYSSSAKGIIDAWYNQNMLNYTDFLEDVVYCNDRSVTDYGGWNSNGVGVSSSTVTKFKNYNATTSLACANETDQFAVSNNKAKLTYPVGLLEDEEINNISTNALMITGNNWLSLSPYSFSNLSANISSIDTIGSRSNLSSRYSEGLRPVISLAEGVDILSGSGTEANPWVIDDTYSITYNSSYLGNREVVNYIDNTTVATSAGPTIPTNSCNTFEGWYEDRDLTIPFNIDNHIDEDIEVYAKYTGNEFCFPYSGYEETFVAFSEDDYTLETWGAQGGSYNGTYRGGYGGYSAGTTTLSNSETLYINVGGVGQATSYQSQVTVSGGYNGGGRGSGNSDKSVGSGGGATHIATSSGVLSSLSNNTSSILMVAGGGGGGSYQAASDYGVGGSGGGSTGGVGSIIGTVFTTGTGGTQTGAGTTYVSGSFGQGANASSNGTGGGGGYYGGGGGQYYAGGGGGSGYLNTSLLNNYKMYCYSGCSGDNTTVVTTTGEHVAQAANTGAGYARITVHATDYKVTYNSTFITFDNKDFTNDVYYQDGTTTIANNGGTVKTPTNACNTFEGWYIDSTFTTPFDINDHIDENIEVYAKYTGDEFCFATAEEHKFKAFYDADYILETWGAQGGSYNSTYVGGYGGYSVGTATISNSETLYVNVGGSGVCSGSTRVSGGYNGGGRATGSNASACSGNVRYGSSGGGATHIATSSGVLSSLSDNKQSILIVAGGGGGSFYMNRAYGAGAGGGGSVGSTSTWTNNGHNYYVQATGGSQTDGGLGGHSFVSTRAESGYFGQAGSYDGDTCNEGSGGGGGYYGGGAGGFSPGSGGSGYLNTSLLTDYGMYCYSGCSGDNTTVVTTTGSHEEGKANTGAGYAKITVILEEYNKYAVTYNSMYLSFNNDKYENTVYYREGTTTIAKNGGIYREPVANACNTFAGWYKDQELTIPYDPNQDIDEDIDLYAKYTGNEFCFPTVGQSKFRMVPNANYKLEVWGAQGGYYSMSGDHTSNGGFGGYSVGTVENPLDSQILYINVGGAGGGRSGKYGGAGGYNGGGAGGNGYNSEKTGGSGGGGATHIATASGTLASLSSNRSSVLIVAGGGGGGAQFGANGNAGQGGGSNGGGGGKASSGYSVGGTQSSGYAFGQGKTGLNGIKKGGSYHGIGGSGGGWFGGTTAGSRSGTNTNSSGAGGSGYLNTSILTNYRMYCYSGCSGDNTTAVGSTGSHVVNAANTGNGYAKITIVNN